MKTVRLGVIFDQQIHFGGGYQQALNAALLARELPEELVQVIFFTTLKENIPVLALHGIDAYLIHVSRFTRLQSSFRARIESPRLLSVLSKFQQFSSPFEHQLIKHEIDLVYFLSPSVWAKSLEKLNYIATVWDLCHRDHPEFPEVRWSRVFESRDKYYAKILPRATGVIVDSVLGARNVIRRYGVDEDRVHVIPFQAAEAARRFSATKFNSSYNLPSKYNIDLPYVFYPAQFWAHKNHVYLLEGLKSLDEHYGKKVGAIFSGVDNGNLEYVKGYAEALGLEDRILFTGFVPNEDIPYLYTQSLALVMPSYFGPTNLPPLEAFRLGVPVLCSNLPGIRDQVGNAALLMDLTNPCSLALHLNNLLVDVSLRKSLISAGFERSKYFEDYDRITPLFEIVQDFRWRRLTWE